MTNWRNSVFYTGFTDDLERRAYEHRNELLPGFTTKYKCKKLIYFEEFSGPVEATYREKQIKRYKREWKINLIESRNSEWKDLYELFLIKDAGTGPA
jgi:putative endonuclease